VLGRINPEQPIGKLTARLDSEAAARAIDEHVGLPLGLDTAAAAEAVLRVANSRMAGAVRLVSIERGFNPKQFVFMPFGGGGGLHACAMLKDVGISAALVPRYPGVTSAMGCVIADMRQDFVQTINTNLADLDTETLTAFMQTHVNHGEKLLGNANTQFNTIETVFELDMAYIGQTHAVSVPIAVRVNQSKVQPMDQSSISEAFDAAYQHSFGRLLPKGIKRLINLRSAVIGKRPKFDLRTLNTDENKQSASLSQSSRRVHFANQWYDTPIYHRLNLPTGEIIEGPAILEQADTTVLIEPGFEGRVDEFGNTMINVKES